MYRELVIVSGNKFPKRDKLIDEKEISKFIGCKTDCYYSHFAYHEPNFDSFRIVDHIVLDFDFESIYDSEKVNLVMKKTYKTLEELKLYYNVYFSGKRGFHVVLPNAWGFTTQDIKSRSLRNTIIKLFPECDQAVYASRSLIRLPNTINTKSGLFKRRIEPQLAFVPDFVIEMAANYDKTGLHIDTWEKNQLPKVLSIGKPLTPITPNNEAQSPICINTILMEPPKKGERHNTALRIASHLNHYTRLPKQSGEAVLTSWLKNEDEISEDYIKRLFSDVSDKYRYGCNDPILQNICSPKCMFYKGKNYMSSKIKISEIYNDYVNKIENGDFIDLSKIYPEFIKNEFMIFNSDLVGIVGSPGAGKSTMAIDMAMRHLSVAKEKAYIILQNLDNSHELAIRRMIQWLTGLNKESIMRPERNNLKIIKDAVKTIESHFYIISDPSIDAVDELVNKWEKNFPQKPTMIIIDHVGVLETNQNLDGYSRMKYLGDRLKSIAKNNSVIVIAIGHIRKADSTANIITAESARDANLGSASDLLIGLTFRDKKKLTSEVEDFSANPQIIISSPKARDNPPFKFTAVYTTNSRFVKGETKINWKGEGWEKKKD